MFFQVDDPNAAMRAIERLANNARSTSRQNEMIPLDYNFSPGPRDVICARGKQAQNHTGNRRLQVVLEMNLQKYSEATTKFEKSAIVSTIVDLIREGSPNGGFVTREKCGGWSKLGDCLARQKVGQCLRDLLHSKYRSSNKSKTFRRKQCVMPDIVTSDSFLQITAISV